MKQAFFAKQSRTSTSGIARSSLALSREPIEQEEMMRVNSVVLSVHCGIAPIALLPGLDYPHSMKEEEDAAAREGVGGGQR